MQALLGAEHDSEIIFTSCGTESELDGHSSALKAQPDRNTVIATTVEHPAILTLCEWLEKEGYIVHKLKVINAASSISMNTSSLLNERVAIVWRCRPTTKPARFSRIEEMAALAAERASCFPHRRRAGRGQDSIV